jgi:hypothetical protein
MWCRTHVSMQKDAPRKLRMWGAERWSLSKIPSGRVLWTILASRVTVRMERTK